MVIAGGEVDDRISLAGLARREDATTALKALKIMCESLGVKKNESEIISALNSFPGVGRRFERIFDGVYTDYAHHPEEIVATIEIAREEVKNLGKKGVVVVYEPHQNTRQHEVKAGYKTAFDGADKVFWLPTYLTREDESLKILTPEDFIADLANKSVAESAEMDEELGKKLKKYVADGYLVLLMTAGPADAWLRSLFGVL
jgi:UDP-N-acetylmuramate--alanine ligase